LRHPALHPGVTRGLDHASRVYSTCELEVPKFGYTRVRVVHSLRNDFFRENGLPGQAGSSPAMTALPQEIVRAYMDSMSVTKEEVLAALEAVKSPDGVALPRTGTLSEVVAGEGKVFFSITVDASTVKAWENVRK